MEVDTEAAPADVRRAVRLLWRRRWWIIVITGLALATSLAMSSRTAEVYASVSRVSIADPISLSTLDFALTRPQRTLQQEMESQLQLVTSRSVIDAVRTRLGDAAALIDDFDSSQIGETNIIAIRVESRSPRVAQAAANAVAEAYVEEQREVAAAALQAKADELTAVNEARSRDIAELDKQIADLNGQIASLEARQAMAGGPNAARVPAEIRAGLATATGSRSSLQQQRDSLSQDVRTDRSRINQLDIAADLQRRSGTQINDLARLPSGPIRPTPFRDAAVATMVGLLLGVGAAYARELFDERIYSPDDATSVAGTRLLGTIPEIRRRRRRRVETLIARQSPVAEAYRSLRTSLMHVPQEDRGVILVTSAGGAEGKTTIVANLAATMAAAGSDVIAVDADLRRPRLAESFSMRGSPGLTSVLMGKTTLANAFVEIPVAAGRLRLLPSGPLPPNPAEVLGSERFAALVEHLRTDCDLVLLDAPPLLPVTDAVVLAGRADAVVVATRARTTRRRGLERAVKDVRETRAHLLGIVFNGLRLPLRANSEYGYYHATDKTVEASGPEWDAVLTPDHNGDLSAWTRSVIDPNGDVPRWQVPPAQLGTLHARSGEASQGEAADRRTRSDAAD